MPEPQPINQLSIDGILAAFAAFDGKYKHAEINAAIAKREEIVPRLIEVLEGVLANPEKVAEDETYFAHMYALMLLGHFGEARAHQVIIALSSLPGGLPHRLFGETITEDLAVILLRTCNGSFDSIKGLVHDRGADDYCRGAAAEAITYGVVEEMVPRTEALSFLGQLLEDGMADPSGAFYDMIACCIHDLYPEELMDKVEAAYAKGFIHPGYIDWESFRQALEREKEVCLLDLKAELELRSLDDIHRSMSWWACFQEPDRQPISSRPTDIKAPKENKKARRKIAKASRKRNRRKR